MFAFLMNLGVSFSPALNPQSTLCQCKFFDWLRRAIILAVLGRLVRNYALQSAFLAIIYSLVAFKIDPNHKLPAMLQQSLV
jgi:hypothetical protein